MLPVGSEIEISAPPHHGGGQHTPLDQLEGIDKARRIGDVQHTIKRMRPDAAPRRAGGALADQQIIGARAIVAEAVDPCEAALNHFALNPRSIAVEQMRQQTAMPIDASAVITERETFAERERRECVF